MRATLNAGSALLTLLLAVPLAAQQSPPGCASEAHAQFDFWVGTWTVTNPDGAVIGRNTIERVSSGCALLESWTDARGVDGHSLNFHDPESGTWHQLWMGSNGQPLRLEGNPDGPGRMVLEGGPRNTPQGAVRDRISWTLRPDGSVEQLWEIAPGGGSGWEIAFRGIYRRSSP